MTWLFSGYWGRLVGRGDWVLEASKILVEHMVVGIVCPIKKISS